MSTEKEGSTQDGKVPDRPVVNGLNLYYTTRLDPEIKLMMKGVHSFFIVGHGPDGTKTMTNIAAENLGQIEMAFERELAKLGYTRKKIDIGSEEAARAVAAAIKSEM